MAGMMDTTRDLVELSEALREVEQLAHCLQRRLEALSYELPDPDQTAHAVDTLGALRRVALRAQALCARLACGGEIEAVS